MKIHWNKDKLWLSIGGYLCIGNPCVLDESIIIAEVKSYNPNAIAKLQEIFRLGQNGSTQPPSRT